MRELLHRLIFLSALLGGLSTTVLHAADWKLVWADDFKTDGLPDPAKWDYEEGFVRNNEQQYYTKGRLDNARVEKGMLVIEGRKESFPNAHYKPGSQKWGEREPFAQYTSASINTLYKSSCLYGRIEMRAKIPQGAGVWPAFWTLGVNRPEVNWPECGEIDIMEFVGKQPDAIHGTLHWKGADGKHKSNGSLIKTPAPYDDFHIYAVEWTPEQIDFYFDGTKYHSFKVDQAGEGASNAFRKPHYILLNLALGGNWGGPIDDSKLPQKYFVNYVHVYERASGQ